jgi:stearoyl-CoA desaturase (Delta-9 desaturase)
MTFGLPILIIWANGATFEVSFYGNIFRYIVGLHLVWMVNSYAHLFGAKPFDKHISPTDTYLVGFCALGEGMRN